MVPEITCSVLIGHDLPLLQWCVANARQRAGMPHNWLVVNWISAEYPHVAKTIKNWCFSEGLDYASYPGEPVDVEHRTAWFLRNLYRGWNLLYEAATTQWVVRMGSDQFFSNQWLANLMAPSRRFGDGAVYHCWTVESTLAKHSRHQVRDFGGAWDNFNVTAFDQYAAHLIQRYESRMVLQQHECALFYHHPTRGMQVRPDGVTWAQTRAMWEQFGPMPDGVTAEGVTGDVAYMDRLMDAQVPLFLVPGSVVYHLVRGESREVQQ